MDSSLCGIADPRNEDEDQFTTDAHAVVRSLHSENAAGAILLQALESQKREFGVGGTTLISMSGALAEAVVDLARRGYVMTSIQVALRRAEEICIRTITLMQLQLDVVIRNFHQLARREKLEALAALLLLTERHPDQQRDALAIKATASLDSAASAAIEVLSAFAESIDDPRDLLTIHCVHGGCSVRSSTRVVPGIVVPVKSESCDRITYRLKDVETPAGIAIFTGVVTLDGDLPWSQSLMTSLQRGSAPWGDVQVVFVSGTVASQVLDFCSSASRSFVCIPIPSSSLLEKLARISGAIIAEAWQEVLLESVGRTPISFARIEALVATNSRWHKEDELSSTLLHIDRASASMKRNEGGDGACFPFVSILVQAPTRSQSVEVRNEIERAIQVLSRVLQSPRGVIPAAECYLCAIASVISSDASATEVGDGARRGDPASDCLLRIAEAFRQLCVLLLTNHACLEPLNDDQSSDGFLARLAAVRKVEQQFTSDMKSVGADTFFASYNFKSSDYSTLRTYAGQSLQDWRADDATATEAAVRRSFRAIQLLGSIGSYEVNSADGESEHENLY